MTENTTPEVQSTDAVPAVDERELGQACMDGVSMLLDLTAPDRQIRLNVLLNLYVSNCVQYGIPKAEALAAIDTCFDHALPMFEAWQASQEAEKTAALETSEPDAAPSTPSEINPV